ncbi:MAG: YeeE/YedE family protein [Deltaproteobacteria bacterium]|nr:YeeE/YedE family protein [Deltaproteobacteria bacterium]
MKSKLAGLLFGSAAGFLIAWAHLTDPEVIRRMLLLKEADVFLLMGAAVVVAGIGVRVLRFAKVRTVVTGEAIAWTVERPRARHFVGSVFFGAGWSIAGTCPGPVAAMIGEGRLGGMAVATGLFAGVALQNALEKRRGVAARTAEVPGAAGL